MENKEGFYSLREIINTGTAFVGSMRSKWWVLVIIAIVGAGIGLAYYYKQKPRYEATTTFILEEKSVGGGGLAGLASQFGFNIGGTSGSLFAGDNILNILRSKKVIYKVLLGKLDSTAANTQTLIDLYLTFSGTRNAWKNKPGLYDLNFTKAENNINPIQDSVLNLVYATLLKKNLFTERISNKGTIISVQVIATNSLFARMMSERIVEEAARLYLEIKTGTSEANIKHMQNRSDSLLLLLNRQSFTAAASQPLDINPALRTAIVPGEIASRDKTILATLYAEVTKNLEASKLLLSQQTPIIEMLDRPQYLLDDNKRGVLFLMIVFSIIICFIYAIYSFIRFLLVRAGWAQNIPQINSPLDENNKS